MKRSALLALSAVLSAGTLLPAAAQYVPDFRPVLANPGTLRPVLTASGPGSEAPRTPPMVLPPHAVREIRPGERAPFASTDPPLYSTIVDINADTFVDLLWGFPTLGRDPQTRVNLVTVIPSTTQAAATAPNNFAPVTLGQIGGPGRISFLAVAGGLYPVGNLATASTGSVLIRFYDGVDFTNADRPLNAKIARTVNGNPAEYIVRFNTPTSLRLWGVDLDLASPVVINDPQGRFGVLVAKTDDAGNPANTPANVVWYNAFDVAIGANLTWFLRNGNDSTLQLFTEYGDANHNMGAYTVVSPTSRYLNNGPLNQMFEVCGRNANNTIPQVGTLEGTLRLRGVDPPDGSDGTPTEDRPNFFAISFFQPNGGPLVRTVYTFTQPSYDANGLLVNYRIPGVRAGTYDIVVEQMPVFNASGQIDILRPLNIWPFADFVPGVATNVTFVGGNVTVRDFRLERFGDMDDGSGTGTPDGAVDLFDLALLIQTFDLLAGDPGFIASADIAGDPNVNSGIPDDAIDLFDLAALIDVFDRGLAEP
ncbi:MAG: hypothetical protein RMJ43_06580 [Chloroherpetonaceae bacterium]|nr:hypothetical protein [Chloroherpetonaceae bacterium]